VSIEVRTTFGTLLREYRLAAGLTQETLADRAGLGARTVQKLERDVHRPRGETARRLARALALPDTERARFERAAAPAPRRRRNVSPLPAADGASGSPGDRRRRHNLPAQLTSFVGREREIAEVARLLSGAGLPPGARPGAEPRLVTLTGPPGTGKTRLALEAAASMLARFPDGVRFVPLAPVRDPGLVVAGIAQALDVREVGGRPMPERLTDFLQGRRLLLVLDNFEHVLAAAPVVAELLGASPRVKVLATSRERLNLGGEHELVVSPLALPDLEDVLTVEGLNRYDATRLFLDRARTARADWVVTAADVPALVGICHRLDGLPLAIELAAARVRHLPVCEIAEHLDDRFRLLVAGSRAVPARHQTLRALVDWSHDLLAEAERVLFRRLAVFAGGWTLEAAEAVAAGDGIAREEVFDLLSRLVDQSLVVLDRRGYAGRYRFLETLRQYAEERLDASGEAEAVGEKHAAYVVALAERLAIWPLEALHRQHLDRLDLEHDNVRAALQWLTSRGDGERSLRIVRAVEPFWNARGYYREGNRWLEASLGSGGEIPAALRAEALGAASRLAWARGDFDAAAAFARESVAISRQLGEPRQLLDALRRLATVSWDTCAFAESLRALEERQEILRDYDNPLALAQNLFGLGMVAREQGDLPRARSLFEQALAIARTLDYPRSTGTTLFNLGLVVADEGDHAQARSLYVESAATLQSIQDRQNQAFLLEAFASLAVAGGQPRRGAVLAGAATALRQLIGSPVPPMMRPRLDRTRRLAREGLGEEAFGQASAEGRAMTPERAVAYALEGDAG
jgi:non-specific serine/threonine protein kinase